MSKVFYTADLHLGHRRVAEIRGYDDPADHDSDICRSWRLSVSDDDWVYVLGDLGIEGSHRHALDLVSGLPGRKVLVCGNHDPVHPMNRDSRRFVARYAEVFEQVVPYARRRIQGIEVLLSHYPYRADHTEPARDLQWRLPDLESWLLHGHTHSEKAITSPNEIHVGWDAWCRLVPEATIARLIGCEA